MALFGRIETVREQAPLTQPAQVAWQYIAELMREGSAIHRRVLALSAGASDKHELGSGVFAIEQAYLTKTRPEGFFESHRKYIDIQVIVAGEEVMEVIDLSQVVVEVAYDESRDLVKYRDTPKASPLRVGLGHCAMFFPADVHMPGLRVGETSALVRKSVLKVPVG
jgi:YhcH/YjgK/YiaL family protein